MKRNPNGYGTVCKLSGNRYKPYAAYTPYIIVKGQRKRITLGYFATPIEAQNALSDFNREHSTKIDYTLKELYEEWNKKAYRSLSKSTIDNYKASWSKLSPLYERKVRNIRSGDFQIIIDNNSELSHSSLHKIKVLSGLLEKYAMQYDIIPKNYASFIILPTEEKIEKLPFTDNEIKTLIKSAKTDFGSQLIVCMIFSGWRVSEFLQLRTQDFDRNNFAMVGGNKTENGKGRIVPVHPLIKPYISKFLERDTTFLITRKNPKTGEFEPITSNYFRNYIFSPTLSKLGIENKYTPHSTRHTFATLCHRCGVDPVIYRKLLGHSQATGGITEQVYIHPDFKMLKKSIELLKI